MEILLSRILTVILVLLDSFPRQWGILHNKQAGNVNTGLIDHQFVTFVLDQVCDIRNDNDHESIHIQTTPPILSYNPPPYCLHPPQLILYPTPLAPAPTQSHQMDPLIQLTIPSSVYIPWSQSAYCEHPTLQFKIQGGPTSAFSITMSPGSFNCRSARM
jgi:hypothetical protein